MEWEYLVEPFDWWKPEYLDETGEPRRDLEPLMSLKATLTPTGLQQKLTQLGAESWELVEILHGPDAFYELRDCDPDKSLLLQPLVLVFKRPNRAWLEEESARIEEAAARFGSRPVSIEPWWRRYDNEADADHKPCPKHRKLEAT